MDTRRMHGARFRLLRFPGTLLVTIALVNDHIQCVRLENQEGKPVGFSIDGKA